MPPQQIASYDESTFHAQEEHIVRKAEFDDSQYKASSLPRRRRLIVLISADPADGVKWSRILAVEVGV